MNKTFERVSFLDVPSVTKDDVKEIVRDEINHILKRRTTMSEEMGTGDILEDVRTGRVKIGSERFNSHLHDVLRQDLKWGS
jgi:hypothetical protein